MNMGITSVTYTPDDLLAGTFPRITERITIIAGEGSLSRGQLLGKISKVLGAVTADAGNTGSGTVVTTSLGVSAQPGIYTLTCIKAVVNAGMFKVENSHGGALPPANVGIAYANAQLSFTIIDGATDFVVGDKFTIAVDTGSGKYRAISSTNTDGSNEPGVVLAEAVNASIIDTPAPVYLSGEFNISRLTGYAASHADILRSRNIFVKTPA